MLLGCHPPGAGAVRHLRRHRRERRLLLQGVHHLREGCEWRCGTRGSTCAADMLLLQRCTNSRLLLLRVCMFGMAAAAAVAATAPAQPLPLLLLLLLLLREAPHVTSFSPGGLLPHTPPPSSHLSTAARRLPQDHQPGQCQNGPLLRAEKVWLQEESVRRQWRRGRRGPPGAIIPTRQPRLGTMPLFPRFALPASLLSLRPSSSSLLCCPLLPASHLPVLALTYIQQPWSRLL